MKSLYFLLLICLTLISLRTIASRTKIAKAIAENLKRELENFDENYQEDKPINKSLIYMSGNNAKFYLNTFRIRIRPFIEFKLPGVASLRVRPRFALVWGRSLPKGWKKYSP